MNFINSIKSEWLKTKRSAAFWLCLIGGTFIPIIYLIVFFVKGYTINSYHTPLTNCWQIYFKDLWRNSAVFILPMSVIFFSSLITQIENKNNTWKQVHASPQSFSRVFFSKFTVIILMTILYFIFFNFGILFSGILPSLILEHKFPVDSLPISYFLIENVKFFITCLPILAFQYLLSLQFKNFLIPIGIGFLGLVSSLIGISWKNIFISPYSYCTMAVFPFKRDFNIFLYAFAYFIILMILSFFLYYTRKDKG